jgi:hypothetical protein
MIPEKWDKLYLYASVIDQFAKVQTGELFFYYIPKGILKKNPVNVYEIPSKFNIEESDYLNLVEMLYNSIKELREEFRTTEQELWSNITISIENYRFKVEYNYEKLQGSEYTSYERHIIWRYKYLELELSHLNKEERNIIKRYLEDTQYVQPKVETYEEGIYIKDIKNIIDYDTESYETTQNVEYVSSKNNKTSKNQILKY